FRLYGVLPAYRAMLDREGVAGPGDIAVVGDEDTVTATLARLAALGVTDFQAVPFAVGPDKAASAARTYALLARLAKG
ncbi:MAG: LLM class F420-dependent oxidoreductase, partial [Chloroflexota bacterium]|nr:LLM class F420-dependent oxidoreductase [Chloroflexota bacterium]